MARYRAEGREASIAYHSSMESVDGRWYVFIIEERDDGRLYSVAHGHPAPIW